MLVKVAPDVLMQELEEEVVLLDMKGGRYFGMDEVGTSVWKSLSEDGDVEAAIRAVESEYDADAATIRQDVTELVQALLDAELVLPADASA
ncbi:MAG: PqqD family protein [Litorilinea sp.]